MSARADTAEIKQMLQARMEALARDLLPDGTRNGCYWIAKNPSRQDRTAGSFYVWLTGVPGAWRDDATGQKGDVFKLIQLVQGSDFKAGVAWARAWLGLDGLPAPERRQRAAEADAFAKKNDDARALKQATDAGRALACFIDSKARPFLGSPADLYLQGRGIDVRALGRVPGCLGWLPHNRHAETDTKWPVMVAGFTGADEKICAIHRTFLSVTSDCPTGNRPLVTKAPVSPARKIWPSFGGAAIRLWRGASKLSVGKAAQNGLLETLVLVEGVEDGLSVAIARPDLRVWCAGSLGNLGQIVLPPCCDKVIVCADNDWGKPQAQKLLNAAVANLVQQGAEVGVARSHVGKDVNDCLRGAA
jgi:hypothetical protein